MLPPSWSEEKNTTFYANNPWGTWADSSYLIFLGILHVLYNSSMMATVQIFSLRCEIKYTEALFTSASMSVSNNLFSLICKSMSWPHTWLWASIILSRSIQLSTLLISLPSIVQVKRCCGSNMDFSSLVHNLSVYVTVVKGSVHKRH